MKAVTKLLSGLLLAISAVPLCLAQDIVLDRQYRAGDLILFQSMSNEDEYFYVADRLSLERDSSGMPKFSFLQYTDTSAADDDASAAGGIVHAVVELQVPDNILAAARRALRQIDPQGEIIGPAPFRAGTFALISSFADAQGDLTDAVLGVGKAPLLEGEKAAVSLKLTKRGSEILRESFNTATPDISFSFEMELAGYYAPKRALLTADFETIYNHDQFDVGVATPFVQGEITGVFEDLRRQNAIRLEQVGDDENLQALVDVAYKKLIEVMFEKADSTGSSALAAAASGAQSQGSVLGKANALLTERRKEVREENKARDTRNKEQAEKNEKAASARVKADLATKKAANANTTAANMEKRAERARRRAAALEEIAQQPGRTEEDRARIRQIIEASNKQAETFDKKAQESRTQAAALETEAGAAEAEASESEESVKPLEQPESMPSLAIVASYKMKRSRVSGTSTFDLNKYTAGSITLRFDENIGDLTDFGDNEEVFRIVDLRSSGLRDRNVQVALDIDSESDFGDYINSAEVLLKRTHDNGSVSDQSIAITRQSFQSGSNLASLVYARLGDDTDGWLDYDYEVKWKFLGGLEIEQGPERTDASTIILVPPIKKREVFFELDPGSVQDLGIRAIDLKVRYNPGDGERVIQKSLRPGRVEQDLSYRARIVLPEDRFDYSYEVVWMLQGGRRVESGRIDTSNSFVFLDEIPEV